MQNPSHVRRSIGCAFLHASVLHIAAGVPYLKGAARQSATVPILISREATRRLQEYFMAAIAGPGDISRTKILRVCQRVARNPLEHFQVIS